ncbi:MAG: hypothetical protein ACFFCM_10395 [Promethearchaeota archaeon]
MEKENKESKKPLRGYPYRQKESVPPPKPPSKSNPTSNPGPNTKEKEMKRPVPKPAPPSYGVYSRK